MEHKKIINQYQINLASAIYGSYVKKSVLADLVYNTYSDSSISEATELNIFIDLNSVMHPLYSEHNRIIFENITDLSSGLINMCAHYRSFFRELQVNTRFYLIQSLNTCDINCKFVPEYNGVFKGKAEVTNTKPLIDNNLALLKILCPYLPQIYYVESIQNFEFSVIVADIIERLNDRNPNLIISRDLYPLQLTALYPYTSYLFPIKKKTEDISWMLPINEKQNYRYEFWHKVALMKKYKLDYLLDISPINYALFLALTYCPERNLKGLVQPITAKKFIFSIVGSEDIKIQPSQYMEDKELCSNYPIASIDARYKAIDVTFMLPYYRNSPESKQLQFVDLEDNATVNSICARYYTNNPLDLLKL